MRESTAAQKGFLKNRREKSGASPALLQHGRNREVLVNCLKKVYKKCIIQNVLYEKCEKVPKKDRFF